PVASDARGALRGLGGRVAPPSGPFLARPERAHDGGRTGSPTRGRRRRGEPGAIGGERGTQLDVETGVRDARLGSPLQGGHRPRCGPDRDHRHEQEVDEELDLEAAQGMLPTGVRIGGTGGTGSSGALGAVTVGTSTTGTGGAGKGGGGGDAGAG